LDSGANAQYRIVGGDPENVSSVVPLPVPAQPAGGAAATTTTGPEDSKDDDAEAVHKNDIEAAVVSGHEVFTNAGTDDVHIELVDKPPQGQ
jgi:hypothetical protein